MWHLETVKSTTPYIQNVIYTGVFEVEKTIYVKYLLNYWKESLIDRHLNLLSGRHWTKILNGCLYRSLSIDIPSFFFKHRINFFLFLLLIKRLIKLSFNTHMKVTFVSNWKTPRTLIVKVFNGWGHGQGKFLRQLLQTEKVLGLEKFTNLMLFKITLEWLSKVSSLILSKFS